MPAPPALTRPPKARPASAPTSTSPPPATPNPETAKEAARIKLHITPFTHALLKSYIPPSALPSATEISFHTIETFPEKSFGYVELPAMEAQKLKKKLHGSVLKGSKVRIEDAKPEKRKKGEKDGEGGAKEEDRPAKRSKKEKGKRSGEVVEGYELPEPRKVKRGWTEARGQAKGKADKKDKKEKGKESQYLKGPEMLFKAKLTPVAAAAEGAAKAKKSKDDGKEKKGSKASREVVVHEFAKTSKHPSFLKSSEVVRESKQATEYVNGKGWVDEDGNVVEPETGKAKRTRVVELAEAAPQETTRLVKGESSKEGSAEPTKSKTKAAINTKKSKQATPPSDASSDESSDSSSDVSSESSDSDSDSESDSVASSNSQASSSSVSSTAPTKPLRNITLTPPPPSAAETKEVHPLEALFKLPKPPAIATGTTTPSKLAPINTSFSFFETDGDNAQDEDGDTSMKEPHTPFTRQDLQWRGLRSAAPTPDTAAIGRRFSFPWGRDDAEDEEESDVGAGVELKDNTRANAVLHALKKDEMDAEVDANATPLGRKEGEERQGEDESEFSKWFWEHRGENNRAWKKRRRDALKVERQRENRRTGRKVV